MENNVDPAEHIKGAPPYGRTPLNRFLMISLSAYYEAGFVCTVIDAAGL